MRLINTTTLELHEFLNENAPPYAILSHAWGDQEVTFQEWESRQKISWKHGYSKILKACNEALKYKLEWLWVDTNCIDKSSSAELSEAINSMFAYYQKSEVCFAYLVDVPTANQTEDVVHSQIEKSRWFTRGWTLQELIAPKHLSFHAADWTYIGRKDGPVSNLVSLVTQIDKIYLSLEASIHEASVAKRMSWLAKRTTTRTEDMAYCMLGIFDINMPLLYGEGKRAFFRLQEEIIKSSNDNTIFCWGWNEDVPNNWASLLAPWPTAFDGAGGFERLDDDNDVSAFSMSNAGLSIQLPTTAEVQYEPTNVTPYLAMLKAKGPHSLKAVCIRLAGRWVDTGRLLYAVRLPYPPRPIDRPEYLAGNRRKRSLLVMNKLSNSRLHGNWEEKTRFSHSEPLHFRISHYLAGFKAGFRCAALHGCDCVLDGTGDEFAFRLHSEDSEWAAILVGKTNTLLQTRLYILLGGVKKDTSHNISVGLKAVREDGLRREQQDEDETILCQWRQKLMSDNVSSWIVCDIVLGITTVLMHKPRDRMNDGDYVYKVVLYEDGFGGSG